MLRQFFPKGTDLSVYNRADLDEAERKLNGRLRKSLEPLARGREGPPAVDVMKERLAALA